MLDFQNNHSDRDGLAVARELYSIRQKVHQDLHIPQLVSHNSPEQRFLLVLTKRDPIVLALGIGDVNLVVPDNGYLLLRRLILHSIIRLANQVIEVEVLLVELEVHRLEFGQVKQIVYQSENHARLVENVLQVTLCLRQGSSLLITNLL